MQIWLRNTAFFFANFRICDLWTGTRRKFADLQFAVNHYKFVDLQFADWHTSEICKFAMRNGTKNLRVCDLKTIQKISMPTFGLYRDRIGDIQEQAHTFLRVAWKTIFVMARTIKKTPFSVYQLKLFPQKLTQF